MNHKSAAYITGLGVISAIGNNVSENLNALNAMQAGIGRADLLKSIHQLPLGEIKCSNQELADKCGALGTLPRTALLSILAAKEALSAFEGRTKGFRIGLLSANTVGGMDLTEKEYPKIKSRGKIDPRNIWYHESGSITELTAAALELEDCWTTTISTACSSSANTIMMGARLIEQGKMDIVIAGGADSLSQFTLNGFNSLMILDKELCQPFDEHRRGLNLGEGAAYVVLMNEQTVKSLKAEKLAIVSGYANANDAHHQTASSPEGNGNQLAMKNAIQQAGIRPGHIDYINLHGTGTANNDSSEGIAIEKIFEGHKIPEASSTKCYTGHTLGAAGAIEAVFSVLAIREQKTWAHLRLETPIRELSWQPNQNIVAKQVRHVLSNSFGFGGNCSALVISAVIKD
ncbi:MAG: beta-ketoacyl-[acyl-carrier-protein] synthase family protein [Sphingobacteriales bacterium]|nr:MAG: beta-ketoacyl-[acyl-carrier-protein] synthase family protein [Sphingobacteriales bacterium]